MKNFIIAFIGSILLFNCNKVTENPVDDSVDFKAVEQIVQGVFDDIWSNKNEDLLSKYHTNDFILLEHGEVWTNDTIANWCKRAKIRDNGVTRINSFDFFKAKKEDNRIWMAYHNYATFKKDTLTRKMQWLESVVAVKQDSVWKLELMHSTRVNKR
ncbi:nuclear transport factor 2 family protein [Neotamlana laminarinivorans]|uniref:Nuclear transport factor 2 family protein n=1 Tax=Neotamlana laminarinivorans TaxID=2883124 RepID=A0A9X1L168_9FLAO|nr:nuclear transport factor 2 family protein [Tamlana laminarinivorans]MCB4798433.1 nuclear transport factor 2 family protein [Tamlana laminarinivorans]